MHPMVRETVEADLGAERSRLHREAARLLHADGALDGVVATHLLAAEPTNDPWAAEILASAGRRALAEGAPDVALRLLARAEPQRRRRSCSRSASRRSAPARTRSPRWTRRSPPARRSWRPTRPRSPPPR